MYSREKCKKIKINIYMPNTQQTWSLGDHQKMYCQSKSSCYNHMFWLKDVSSLLDVCIVHSLNYELSRCINEKM